MLKLIAHLAIATLVFSFTHAAFAASVTQVKGNRVMINLEGESVANGTQVYLVNSNGKRVALVKITAVKGDRAMGTISKGKAQAGLTVQIGGGSSSASSSDSSAPSTVVRSGSGGPNSKKAIGVLAGFGMQSMSLTAQYDPDGSSGPLANRSESASLKGSSISIKAFMDYRYSDSFTVRLATGLEPFKATGSTSALICSAGTTQNCEVSFNYITFEGGIQYNISNSNSKRIYAGLGYAFLMEMGKSITVPNLNSSGKTNQMLLIGGGLDWKVNTKGSYVPIVVEYGMFPGSSNVSASSIFVRSGYAFSF